MHHNKKNGLNEMLCDYHKVDHETNYIYVVISATPTKFGRVIRKFIHQTYNHASIAFDRNLEELYSFGRKQNKVPLVAGLVKEYPERFSLKKAKSVNICIYRVPVSKEQFEKGRKRIHDILNDDEEYLYNLFSVLTYPVFHGFSTYKAYSCVEFVAHMLIYMDVPMINRKKRYEYTPEELGESIVGDMIFQGNLLEYCDFQSIDSKHFFERPNYVKSSADSCVTISRLIYRKVKRR
ncbi:MAG TPA: hypothetical protein VJZ04_00180 [Lachnospiraceae bacterium]|nr:hypothetical protein [Lachnospiraceae bacterium]